MIWNIQSITWYDKFSAKNLSFSVFMIWFFFRYRHIYKTLKPTTYYIEADVVLSSLQQVRYKYIEIQPPWVRNTA